MGSGGGPAGGGRAGTAVACGGAAPAPPEAGGGVGGASGGASGGADAASESRGGLRHHLHPEHHTPEHALQQRQRSLLASAAPDWREFVAGAVSGAAGVAAGNPLDVVRVRLQQQGPVGSAGARYSGVAHCVRSMLAQEGGRSFFKGLAGPLYSVAFQNAAVFTAYEAAVRVVQSLRSEGSDATGAARDPPPTLGEAYVAGLMAGIAQTALVTPIDLIKIQRQLMAPGGGGAEEARASAVVRTIVAREGVAGLFRGALVTALRDAPSFGVYFATYAKGLDVLAPGTREDGGDPVSPWAAGVAGGVAGMVSWASIYPLDVIKTRLQARRAGSAWVGPLRAAREVYARDGARAFAAGFGATMAKAFVCSAAIFPVYELAMHRLR